MKKLFLGMFLILTACNSGNSPVKDSDEDVFNSDIIYDVSNFSLGSSIVDIPDSLDFGTASPPSSLTLSKSIKIANLGSSAVSFSAAINSQANGFKIKLNRCKLIIAPKSSCQIIVEFSSRGLFTGSNSSSLDLGSDSSSGSIILTANITGQDNPDSSGTPQLSLSLDSPFEPIGASPIRTLTIKNEGTGTANNISSTIPPEYVIWTNHCPSTLKPSKSCQMKINLKNYRSGAVAQDSAKISVLSGDQESILGLKLGNIIPAPVIADSFVLPQLYGNVYYDSMSDYYDFPVGSAFSTSVTGELKSIEFGYVLTPDCEFRGIPSVEVYSADANDVALVSLGLSDQGVRSSSDTYKFSFSSPINLTQNSRYVFVTRIQDTQSRTCRYIPLHHSNVGVSRLMVYSYPFAGTIHRFDPQISLTKLTVKVQPEVVAAQYKILDNDFIKPVNQYTSNYANIFSFIDNPNYFSFTITQKTKLNQMDIAIGKIFGSGNLAFGIYSALDSNLGILNSPTYLGKTDSLSLANIPDSSYNQFESFMFTENIVLNPGTYYVSPIKSLLSSAGLNFFGFDAVHQTSPLLPLYSYNLSTSSSDSVNVNVGVRLFGTPSN